MAHNELLRPINNYAMQNGIVLGLFGIATLAVLGLSFTVPFFSTLYMVMAIGSPVFAAWLTLRVRRALTGESGPFSFLHAFLHTLLTGFYASLWIAVFIFVYLQYMDRGQFFDSYALSLQTPEMQAYLQQSGAGEQMRQTWGEDYVKEFTGVLRSFGAANYAALELYVTFFFAPVISAVVALFCKRK